MKKIMLIVFLALATPMSAQAFSTPNAPFTGTECNNNGSWCGEFKGRICSGNFEQRGWCTNRPIPVRPTPPVTQPPVPVPAALWLFGSALIGLGFIRRKK